MTRQRFRLGRSGLSSLPKAWTVPGVARLPPRLTQASFRIEFRKDRRSTSTTAFGLSLRGADMMKGMKRVFRGLMVCPSLGVAGAAAAQAPAVTDVSLGGLYARCL